VPREVSRIRPVCLWSAFRAGAASREHAQHALGIGIWIAGFPDIDHQRIGFATALAFPADEASRQEILTVWPFTSGRFSQFDMGRPSGFRSSGRIDRMATTYG